MNENIQKQLLWRFATKKFIPGEKVTGENITTILESARMAPTAYGLQPFRVIHVTDLDLREKLKVQASFNQPQVTDAGDFFVIAVRTDIDDEFIDEYVNRTAITRGLNSASLDGFSQMMKGDILVRDQVAKWAWAGRQAYIALGFMLETAMMLDVDTCPMEGFIPEKTDEILGLSALSLTSLAYCAVGTRDPSDEYATHEKVRVVKENFIIEL